MRIVFSVPYFFPYSFGGGQVYVHRLAKELQRRDQEVFVVTSAPWEGGSSSHYELKQYEYDGLPVTAITINSENLSEGDRHSELSPILLEGLHVALRRIGPDLVHINGLKAAMATISNQFNIPGVVTAHHAGICCPAGDLVGPDGDVCENAVDSGVCVSCCSFKRSPKWYTGGLLGKLPSRVYQPLGRWLNGRRSLPYVARALRYPWLVEESIRGKVALKGEARRVVVPSAFMRDLLIRNGYERDRLTVLPHGILPLEKSFLAPSKAVRFGYLGRINPQKGFHVLIKALEQLRPERKCELHVFGAPQYPWEESYLKKCLKDYRGAVAVMLHGQVPHRELSRAFAEFDILVVPSLVPESFGLVVLEAFSAGRPVIVSDAGALPELVRNGMDGLVVGRGDSDALAKAIQELLDAPFRVREMTQAIRPPKTIGEYADEIDAIYSAEINRGNANKLTESEHA